MFAIVYRSEATPGLNLVQVETLMNKARDFNSRHGITGCLLYHRGTFLQYLEGNQWEVVRLFDRINADSRHKKIELLAHGGCESRDFRRWEIAYENVFGANAMLNYMKLIVSESVERASCPLPTNEASVHFWSHTRKILLRSPFRSSVRY